MIKKVLSGCAAIVGTVLVAIGVLVAMSWDSIDFTGPHGTGDEQRSLSREIEREFGDRPRVELVCQFPVVGVAPCVVQSDLDSREVLLTFTDYASPQEITWEMQARQIATFALSASAFAKGSDKIEVRFDHREDSANVTRKFSFSSEQLTASEVPPESAH